MPEYPDPIRIRWYWTADPDAATDGTDGYSSSDWDPYPRDAPPLGEDGLQRSPFRDWVDGSPPPWPATVPVGTGVGLGIAVAHRVHRALASGISVSLASAVAGYTRSVLAGGNGASLGESQSVRSRTTLASGAGVSLAGSLARKARLAAASGLGSALGVTARTGVRLAAATGTGASLGTAVSLPRRNRDVAGSGSALGTILQRNYRLLTPDQVSGLYGWWKADAGCYKDLGSTLCVTTDTIEQWNDQSGNGHNLTQTTSGKRPQYLTSILNGLPVTRWAGGQCLQLASAAVSTFTMLAVFRASNTGMLIEQSADASTNDGFAFYTGSSISFTVRKSATLSTRNAPINWGSQNLYAAVMWKYGGSHPQHDMFYFDAEGQAATATGNNPGTGTVTATLNVGARNNFGTFPLIGDIAELVLYTPVIPMVDARGVLEYLRQKWDI